MSRPLLKQRLIVGVDMTIRRQAEIDVSTVVVVDVRNATARVTSIGSDDPRWSCCGLTEEEQRQAVNAAWEQIAMALRATEPVS